MKGIIEQIRNFSNDENGATAVEYGIMVALIAAVIIATVGEVGQKVLSAFTTVNTEMPGGAAPAP